MINRRLWPIVIFLFLIASWVYAGNITVNSLEDTNTRDDAITFREAILLSEGELASWILTAAEQVQVSPPVGSGIPDTINFGVSGTIMPTSGLSSITDDGTVIDASSQWSGVWPGGQPGVILDGTDAGNVAGLMITRAANCHIRGLLITNFRMGIEINNAAQFNIIGGSDPGNRNIISGNKINGLWIGNQGTDNNFIIGNYIGTDTMGTADLGNSGAGIGIRNGAQSNTIGGTTAGEGNIISGNDWRGVVIGDSGTDNNLVKGNYIGTDVSGTAALGNSGGILIVDGPQGNIIGGIGAGNIIAFNGGEGFSAVRAGDFNTISRNSIYENAELGIDVSFGGNDGIVPPPITWCSSAGDILTISSGNIRPNATVEVFRADSSGHEGQVFLGNLTVDESGELLGSLPVVGEEISTEDILVVTITDTNGNTSEFSPPLIWTESAISPPTFPLLVNVDGRKLSVGEGGILYHDGRPFRAIGVNYFNAFERTASAPNDKTYRWGFAQLALNGIPFARFMATRFCPRELAAYENAREAYFQCLDGVIQAAEDYGIGLIPSLFWTEFAVPDLVGETVNQWGNPNSRTIAFMRRYTQDIVSRYMDSPAIWAWEFGSEYNILVDFGFESPTGPACGNPATRGPEDHLTTDMIVTAFREFAEVVRSIDPKRPITTGNASPRRYAEELRLGHGWSELDTRDEFKANISLVNPSPCDTMSIKLFDDVFYERFEPGYYPSYDDIVSLAMEASVQDGKALYVAEMGISDHIYGLETAAPLRQEMLDAVVEHDVVLAAVWVFDMPIVSGSRHSEGWNIRLPDRRMYLLEAIRDANEAILAKLAGEQYINYPWDVNGDGKVDVLDLVFVVQYFGRNVKAPLYLNPDVNGDGSVDILDIILVAQHFGEVYSPAAPSRSIWKVDREHLPLLTRIYDIMEKNPRSDPDFLAAKRLIRRLISDTSVSETEVFQNYPNPFNPDTWIPYQLREDSDVIIKIYTSTGQLVRTLNLGHKSAGVYINKENAAYWDGRNEEGERTASGIYFCRIQAGEFTAIKKMVIVE